VSAWTREGEIMGLRHKTLPVEGVQFHPESFLTLEGARLLANWLGSLPETPRG
jgi:anthranilate/para-aminobenzoate synthase component II